MHMTARNERSLHGLISEGLGKFHFKLDIEAVVTGRNEVPFPSNLNELIHMYDLHL